MLLIDETIIIKVFLFENISIIEFIKFRNSWQKDIFQFILKIESYQEVDFCFSGESDEPGTGITFTSVAMIWAAAPGSIDETI